MRREYNIQSGILPSGYRELEYIESTGTQYIDTGVYPTNKTYLYLDFQPLLASKVASEISGSRWTLSPNYMTFAVSDAASANYSLYIYAGNVNNNCYQLTPDSSSYLISRHTAEIDPLNLICRIDNYSHSLVYDTYTSTYTFYLFGFNNIGTAVMRGSVRIYECEFNENNIPIRHFIPALRNNDQKPGLYEIINNVFYTNRGSGEFLYA